MLDRGGWRGAATPYANGWHQHAWLPLADGLYDARALSAGTAQPVVVRSRTTSPNYLGMRAECRAKGAAR
jgi:hypothetical protein